jgi:hypothetical protein
MRRISFMLMMLIAGTGMAAGLQQLIDSVKKPPATAPQPKPLSAPAPQAPKPAPQPMTAPKPVAPATPKPANSNNPTTDNNKTCGPTDSTCKR